MSYKIKIVDDKEFEKLPYPDLDTSLGVADPKLKTAYVRYTTSPELNRYLVNHELEHLIGTDKTHYKHGVYYKDFGNMFQSAGQAVGNLAGPVFNGVGGALKSTAKGVGSLMSPMFQGGGGGGSSSATSAPFTIGGNKSATPAPTSGGSTGGSSWLNQGSPLQSIFQNSGGSGWGSKIGQTVNNAVSGFSKGAGQSVGTNLLNNFMNKSSGSNNVRQPMSYTSPTISASANVSQPNLLGQFGSSMMEKDVKGQMGLSNMGKTVAGLGLTGASQLLGGNPKVPDLSSLPSVQRVANMKFNNYQELDPALTQAVREDYALFRNDQIEALRNKYRNLQPGVDLNSSSEFQKELANLEDTMQKQEDEAIAKYRLQLMANNLQLSQLEMEQLTQLAQLDIDTIMMQLSMDAQSAQDFKKAFSGIGTGLISSGLGLNNSETQ